MTDTLTLDSNTESLEETSSETESLIHNTQKKITFGCFSQNSAKSAFERLTRKRRHKSCTLWRKSLSVSRRFVAGFQRSTTVPALELAPFEFSQLTEEPHAQRIPLFLKQYGVLPEKLALSFSGCGFLGAYHFGVMFCFKRHAKSLLDRVERVAGTSAGSLVACLICYAPDTLEEALNEMFRLADDLNAMKLGALSPGFYMNQHLHKLIDRFLPEDPLEPKHNLYVSVTKQKDRTNHLISEFPSREFLINSLLASCYIPMYSSGYYAQPPNLNNEAYIDGGYTNNLHVFTDIPTISISPFSGSAIIAPADRNMFEWRMSLGNQQMKVNMQNIVRGAQALFPPASNVLHAYYELGFRDGLKFLLQNGLLERMDGTDV